MQEANYEKIKDVAKQYGDGFYLLDTEQFQKNYIELKEAFSSVYSKFNIAYSYKTNYIPQLCKIVNELGGYAEVVSDMELEVALRVGVDPKKIIWNGPIKNIDKVREFLLRGGTVNLDSVYEFDGIRKLLEEFPEQQFNIGIRCNFDVQDGVISRFGFDTEEEDFRAALDFVQEMQNLHLSNLQCHFAKRNVEYWPARAKGMVEVANRVATYIGYMPERLDIGGGIFGNMAESLKAQFTVKIPEYTDYAHAAATVFAEYFKEERPELLIEPGSALVGDCMQFVAKVETLKVVRGKTFATIMGSQKNINMCGVNPPIDVVPCGKERKYYEDVDLVGYTCIEGDVLYRGYAGDLAIGDYVIFSNCGSYSLVMKPPFIFPNFPVLNVSNGEVELIKRGECFDDLFHTFTF